MARTKRARSPSPQNIRRSTRVRARGGPRTPPRGRSDEVVDLTRQEQGQQEASNSSSSANRNVSISSNNNITTNRNTERKKKMKKREPKPLLHLRNPAELDHFEEVYMQRKVVKGRAFDWTFLAEINFPFLKRLESWGWKKFLTMDRTTYRTAVPYFYYNGEAGNTTEEGFKTYLQRTEFQITKDDVWRALGRPRRFENAPKYNRNGYSHLDGAHRVFNKPVLEIIPNDASKLTFYRRVLHFMIGQTLNPRQGGYSLVTHEEIWLMDQIIHNNPPNLDDWVMIRLQRTMNRNTRNGTRGLLYGRLVSELIDRQGLRGFKDSPMDVKTPRPFGKNSLKLIKWHYDARAGRWARDNPVEGEEEDEEGDPDEEMMAEDVEEESDEGSREETENGSDEDTDEDSEEGSEEESGEAENQRSEQYHIEREDEDGHEDDEEVRDASDDAEVQEDDESQEERGQETERAYGDEHLDTEPAHLDEDQQNEDGETEDRRDDEAEQTEEEGSEKDGDEEMAMTGGSTAAAADKSDGFESGDFEEAAIPVVPERVEEDGAEGAKENGDAGLEGATTQGDEVVTEVADGVKALAIVDPQHFGGTPPRTASGPEDIHPAMPLHSNDTIEGAVAGNATAEGVTAQDMENLDQLVRAIEMDERPTPSNTSSTGRAPLQQTGTNNLYLLLNADVQALKKNMETVGKNVDELMGILRALTRHVGIPATELPPSNPSSPVDGDHAPAAS